MSNDLISRKALVHGLMENYEKCMRFHDLLEYINEQPTAYDVDKVVEKMEKYYASEVKTFSDNHENRIVYKLVDVVKEGGV